MDGGAALLRQEEGECGETSALLTGQSGVSAGHVMLDTNPAAGKGRESSATLASDCPADGVDSSPETARHQDGGVADEEELKAKRLENLERQLRDAQQLIALLQVQHEQLKGDGAPNRTTSTKSSGSDTTRPNHVLESSSSSSSRQAATGFQVPAEEPTRKSGGPEAVNCQQNATACTGAVAESGVVPSPPPVPKKPAHIKLRKPLPDAPSPSSNPNESTAFSSNSPKQGRGRSSPGDTPTPGSPKPPPPPPRRGSVLTPTGILTNGRPSTSPRLSPLTPANMRGDIGSPEMPSVGQSGDDIIGAARQPIAGTAQQQNSGSNDAVTASVQTPQHGGRDPTANECGTPNHSALCTGEMQYSPHQSPVDQPEAELPGGLVLRSASVSSTASSSVGSKRFSGALELAELEMMCSNGEGRTTASASTPGSQHRSQSITPVPFEGNVAQAEVITMTTVQRPSSLPGDEPSVCQTSRYTFAAPSHADRPTQPGKYPPPSSQAPGADVLPQPLARSYQNAKRGAAGPHTHPLSYRRAEGFEDGQVEYNVAGVPQAPVELPTYGPDDSSRARGAALRLAAEQGQTACLKVLLAQGVDARTPVDGTSLLHIAAAGGHHRCVEELLEVGADVHVLDSNGYTALDVSASLGHEASVDALLNHMDLTQPLDFQMVFKALSVASAEGHTSCATVLSAAIGRHERETGLASPSPSPLKASTIISPSSTDSALVADVESSGQSPARSNQQLSSEEAGNSLELFLQYSSGAGGQLFGNASKCLASLGTVQISATSSWSEVEMAVWKKLDQHLSAICQPLPPAVVPETQPLTAAGKSVSDQAVKSATLKSITSWTSSLTGGSGSYASGASASQQQLPSAAQLRTATVYASDVGLGVDSVKMYTCGDKVWRPDTLSPLSSDEGVTEASTVSPHQLFGDGESITVTLKGVSDCQLDQLAYQSLIPANILRSYLDKFRRQGKVLFSGPPACGKSEIATGLARCLQNLLKAEGGKVDLLHCPLRGQAGEEDRILSMLHKTGLLVQDDVFVSRRSLLIENLQHRHCILVVESSGAMAIQQGLGHVLSCVHGDQTMWLNEGVLPAGLYRLAGFLHLMVTLDTTGPIGLDPRSWHRFFHIRWRWDVEPLGGQLQRHLQRQYLIGGEAKQAAEREGVRMRDYMIWVNDVWQRINKLFSYLGYNQLVLGPSIFFSCTVGSDRDGSGIASWLAELWNNQLAPCIEEVTASHDPQHQHQHTSVKLLLVTIRLALLPGCPLQGNDLAQWLESLHCGMDSDEINDMVQNIRDRVISNSSEVVSLDCDDDLQDRSVRTPAKPATDTSAREQTGSESVDSQSLTAELVEISTVMEDNDPQPPVTSRPSTPSLMKRFNVLRDSYREKRMSIKRESTKRSAGPPQSPSPQPTTTRIKREETDFFAMISKMQGDRIDDQRVAAPTCMFMQKPAAQAAATSSSSTAPNTPHKPSKAEKKALKKTNSRQSNYENIFTLGRHRKTSSSNHDYENVFQSQKPAARSASADFLATAESDDNVFSSSTSASPDMSALHLPPTAGGSSSLRISSVRRRSMSELVRLSSDKDDLGKGTGDGTSHKRHKSLGKMKSHSIVRGSKEQQHHRSASHVYSLSTLSTVPQEGSWGGGGSGGQKVTPSASLGGNSFPVSPSQQASTLPAKRSQITYM